MPFEPGQILLVEFPFTDHGSAKMRPVVVVSLHAFNLGEDFVALPISSRVGGNDPYSFAVLSTSSYFSATGLKYDSSVKWTKPMTISSRIVKRKMGVLAKEPLAELHRLVKTMFS